MECKHCGKEFEYDREHDSQVCWDCINKAIEQYEWECEQKRKKAGVNSEYFQF